MSIRAGSRAAALALCVASCHADRITTEDVAVTFDLHAWSGGTLVLRSSAFRGGDALPTVMAGADTLGVRSYGSDSVLVQLPDTNGWLALVVRLSGGRSVRAGSVRVHGFSDARAGPDVDGAIYPWPGSGAPTALAIQNGRLVKLDFRFNVAGVLLPDTGLNRGQCLRGAPMPSAANPGLIVISPGPGCGPMIAVPLIPGIAAPDTGPPPSYWPAAHLGRGRWLVNYKYWFQIVTRSPAGGFVSGPQIPASQPFGFAVSPQGDRVVPVGCYGYDTGVPVFDPAIPGVAYYLGQQTGGAAFSAEGDTLFVIVGDELQAVDATSGTVRRRAPIRTNYPRDAGVALDPSRPLVYVAGEWGDRPFVEVFDRATLALVSTLRAPTGLPELTWFLYGASQDVLVLSAAERQLYFVLNSWASTYLLRFELMP